MEWGAIVNYRYKVTHARTANQFDGEGQVEGRRVSAFGARDFCEVTR